MRKSHSTIGLVVILGMAISCGDGKDGQIGPEGKQGEVGTVGPMGPQGPIGQRGRAGEKGEQGDMGPEGPEGKDGADGVDGVDGTKIVMVDPCPDMAVEHPEVLACIDGKAYGVLTDPNWKRIRFVELEEGIWYQTTDGRSCIFKVESDCQIEIR